jgi:hypothetical protein
VTFDVVANVNNILPEDFDTAAREAWVNITASSVENMPVENIEIVSVLAFNASTAQSASRRLIQENVSTVITMAVRDIMENYAFNDAVDFAEFVYSSISTSYSKPEIVATFVDLAISKGSTKITPSTKDTLVVGRVTRTDPEASRVLSGVPTSAPTSEDDPSLIEQIVGDTLLFSLCIVGFCFFILCVVLIYLYCRRKRQREECQREEAQYEEKMKRAEDSNGLFLNGVDFGDDNDDDDDIENSYEKEEVINERAVYSLDKFDSMMSRSFSGLVTEVDDAPPRPPPALKALTSPSPTSKTKPTEKVVRKEKIRRNSASLRAYEAFKRNYTQALAHATSSDALSTSRVASFDKSARWDMKDQSTLTSPRPKSSMKASTVGQTFDRHKYRPKAHALNSPVATTVTDAATATAAAAPSKTKSPSKSNLKRSALSQRSLFATSNTDSLSLSRLPSAILMREDSPSPKSVRQTTSLPGLRISSKSRTLSSNSQLDSEKDLPKRLTFRESKLLSEFAASKGNKGSGSRSPRVQSPSSASTSKEDEWVERFSERKQKVYWKNSVTGVSTWKNPSLLSSSSSPSLTPAPTPTSTQTKSNSRQKKVVGGSSSASPAAHSSPGGNLHHSSSMNSSSALRSHKMTREEIMALI